MQEIFYGDEKFLLQKFFFFDCPRGPHFLLLKPHYYRRYIDDIFVLFASPKHLKGFRNFLNDRLANISFTIESEKQNRISFLDVQITHEDETFTASVYHKPTQIIHEDKTFTTSVYDKPTLVEFMHILTATYHLSISLVLFTYLLIDTCEFAQVGQNYTMNQFF